MATGGRLSSLLVCHRRACCTTAPALRSPDAGRLPLRTSIGEKDSLVMLHAVPAIALIGLSVRGDDVARCSNAVRSTGSTEESHRQEHGARAVRQ